LVSASLLVARSARLLAPFFERSPDELKGRGAAVGTPVSMVQALIEPNLLDADFSYFTSSAMP